jgi:predicted SAM-dependent methyltransferase
MASKSRLTLNLLARVAITFAAFGFFLLLRPDYKFDLPAVTRLAYNRYIATPKLIRSYLENNQVHKLQLGAGTNHKPGWLNTDIEPEAGEAYLNAAEPFPLPDHAFHYVYSEHVMEHLTFEQGLVMLKESYRVLEPGGHVRIATPNLKKYLALFAADKSAELKRYIDRKFSVNDWLKPPEPETFLINAEMHGWGHQFVYTPAALGARLEEAGFRDVQEFEAGASRDPGLVGIEDRIRSNERDVNQYETMVIEAVHP